MKKKVFFTVVALGLMLMVAPIAWGQTGPGMGKHRGMGMMKERAELKDNLKLTADQEKAIAKLRKENFKDTGALRVKMMEKHHALQVAMMEDKWNESQINKLVDEIGVLKAEMMKKRLEITRKIRELLTPQQREIWDEGRAGKGCMGMGGPGCGPCPMGGPGPGGPMGMRGTGGCVPPDFDDDAD